MLVLFELVPALMLLALWWVLAGVGVGVGDVSVGVGVIGVGFS